jgi:hypothetical protein
VLVSNAWIGPRTTARTVRRLRPQRGNRRPRTSTSRRPISTPLPPICTPSPVPVLAVIADRMSQVGTVRSDREGTLAVAVFIATTMIVYLVLSRGSGSVSARIGFESAS